MKYKKSLTALFSLWFFVLFMLLYSNLEFTLLDLLWASLLIGLIVFLVQIDFQCSLKDLFLLKTKECRNEKIVGIFTFILGMSLWMIVRFFQEELLNAGIWLCSFSLLISVWFYVILSRLKS